MSDPIVTGYQQASTYSASADRHVQNVKMTGSTVSVPRDGVVLSAQGPNMDIADGSGLSKIVQPGNAMVAGYSVYMPATTTVTPDPATATARRDLVILRVYDKEAGDAVSEAKVEVVKGTASGTDPALPPRSMILGHVEIGANATTAAHTDRRSFTAAAGGVVPWRDGPALVAATDLAPGQIGHDLHSGRWMGRYGNGMRSIGANFSTSQAQYYASEDHIGAGTAGHREKMFTIAEQTNVLLLFASVTLMVGGPDGAAIFNVGLRWNGTVVTSSVVNSMGSPLAYTFSTYPLFAAVQNVAPGTYEFRYDLEVGAGSTVRTSHWSFQLVGLV